MTMLNTEDEPTTTSGGKGTPAWATRWPSLSPTVCSTGSSRPKCSSTSPTTVAPWPSWPGCCARRTMAVTVPRWWPELVNWRCRMRTTRPGGHVRIYRRHVLIEKLAAQGLEPYATIMPTRCTAPTVAALRSGNHRDDHPAVKAYHRMLVWDISAHTFVTRVPEKLLNPLLGKSAVVYLRKRA